METGRAKMTKLLKITATTLLYSALTVVALDAAFTMDLPSVANAAAMCLGTGFVHGIIWG